MKLAVLHPWSFPFKDPVKDPEAFDSQKLILIIMKHGTSVHASLLDMTVSSLPNLTELNHNRKSLAFHSLLRNGLTITDLNLEFCTRFVQMISLTTVGVVFRRKSKLIEQGGAGPEASKQDL
jgi:hypothetical protein